MRKLFDILRRPAVTFWGTVVLLLLYPLSTGPAAWLAFNFRLPKPAVSAIQCVYAPCVWSAEASQPFKVALFSYERLWVDYSKGMAASDFGPRPERPPLVFELLGALMGAWVVWTFVRWVNQWKVAQPG